MWVENLFHIYLCLPTIQFHSGLHGLGVDHNIQVELVYDLKLLLLVLDLTS